MDFLNKLTEILRLIYSNIILTGSGDKVTLKTAGEETQSILLSNDVGKSYRLKHEVTSAGRSGYKTRLSVIDVDTDNEIISIDEGGVKINNKVSVPNLVIGDDSGTSTGGINLIKPESGIGGYAKFQGKNGVVAYLDDANISLFHSTEEPNLEILNSKFPYNNLYTASSIGKAVLCTNASFPNIYVRIDRERWIKFAGAELV